MIFHTINLLITVILYFIICYLEFGFSYSSYSLDNFFPSFIFIYLVFSIYFTPIKFNFIEKSRLALLQFIFMLLSLSLIASFINIQPIGREFIFLITSLSVAIQWISIVPHPFPTINTNRSTINNSELQIKRIILSFIMLSFSFVIALFLKQVQYNIIHGQNKSLYYQSHYGGHLVTHLENFIQ